MAFAFIYFFLSLIVFAALGVVLAANSMFSVLYLALVFFLVSVLFVIVGAEFLAILLLVIYSGAMILLFLFIIFLLNLRVTELYGSFVSYVQVGVFIGFFTFMSFNLLVFGEYQGAQWPFQELHNWPLVVTSQTNLSVFGYILYEYFGFFSVIVSVILLVSLVLVIVLSVDFKRGRAALSSEGYFNSYNRVTLSM
jgi:NADH-quinone oxidoreductase subunit J